jgi:hypothetical protein
LDNLRVVQFSEAGEGIYLFFRNSDVRRLQDQLGKEYQQIVITSLLGLDQEVMDQCLAVSAVDADLKRVKMQMADLDAVPQAIVQEKLLDAFSLCLFGRAYLDQMKWLDEQVKKFTEQGKPAPPLLSPGASSASSEEQPSGQG